MWSAVAGAVDGTAQLAPPSTSQRRREAQSTSLTASSQVVVTLVTSKPIASLIASMCSLENALEWLVPDRDRRSIVSADIPRLPLSFYDEGCDVPSGWSDEPAGYVLLSDAYRIWAEAARSYGWPVVEVSGTHLEIVNRPDDVASAILQVADAAQQA